MRNHWNLALGLSVMIHILIVTGLPTFKKIAPLKEDEKFREIEIIPQKTKTTIEKNNDLLDKTKMPPYIENVMQKLDTDTAEPTSLAKKSIPKTNLKEIVLSEIPQHKNLKKLPVYMNYYRLIREKIRKNAYHYYRNRDRGEVFLKFIVLQDGSLKDIRLDEQSVNSDLLKRIAVKSVRDATPFPSFPKELEDYAYLQFNISIYFKSNE